MQTCIECGKTITDDADRRPIHSGLAMHEQCYKHCQQRSQPAKWVWPSSWSATQFHTSCHYRHTKPADPA